VKISAVLFPTDFSEASDEAARVARDLAGETGATLHVVHVVPPVTDPANAAELLADAGQRLADGRRIETALLSGRIAREIVRYARARRIDLIVLGTHGRTGFSRAILGSVAEGVVRLARCLVLTVPAGMAPDVAALPEAAVERCIVCARESDEVLCEACRDRVRGDAVARTRSEEQAGRRGMSI
jgi:nucleotide-binding universal stress UspA family protein